MKLNFIILTLVAAFFLTGCQSATGPNDQNAVLAIDLAYAFKDDSVEIRLDDKQLMQAQVSTNYSVSVAWRSGPMEFPKGTHSLQVKIFDLNVQELYYFKLQDTLTVEIRFDREKKKIQFATYKGLILRD